MDIKKELESEEFTWFPDPDLSQKIDFIVAKSYWLQNTNMKSFWIEVLDVPENSKYLIGNPNAIFKIGTTYLSVEKWKRNGAENRVTFSIRIRIRGYINTKKFLKINIFDEIYFWGCCESESTSRPCISEYALGEEDLYRKANESYYKKESFGLINWIKRLLRLTPKNV